MDPLKEKALVEDVYERTASQVTTEFASFTRDLVGAGEWVVALETLCDYLVDLMIELPRDDAVALVNAVEALGIDRYSRDVLESLGRESDL